MNDFFQILLLLSALLQH